MAELLIRAVQDDPVSGMYAPEDDCTDLHYDISDLPKVKRVVCFKGCGQVIYLEYDKRLQVNLDTDVGVDSDDLIDKLQTLQINPYFCRSFYFSDRK